MGRRTGREVRWSTAPAGSLEVVDAPPAGLPQLLGAKLVPPVGGTIAPVDGARVAGGLTGLAAGGTTSVEVTDQRRRCSTSRPGPEIRMGAATQIAVKVPRRAGACSAASTDVEVHVRRRERPHQPGAPG